MAILIQFLGVKEAGPVFSYELAKGLVNNQEVVYAILHKDIDNRDKWIKLLGENNIFFFSKWIQKKNPLKTFREFLIEKKELKKKFKGIIFDYAIRPFVSKYDDWLLSAVKCKYTVNFCHDPIPHSGVKKSDAKDNKNRINRADKIVVLTKKFIPVVEKEYKRLKSDIIFIRHGIMPYTDSKENQFVRYDTNKEIHFIFFGRIDQYKGVDVLSEAFNSLVKKVDNVRLTIAGNGEIYNYLNDISSFSNVEIINRYIDDSEVNALFTKPNLVLVIPYKDATQSGVISLAYEYEIPIIATDTGGLREQLFDGEVGILVEPNNVDELEMAMKRFVDNPYIYIDEARKVSKYKQELEWDTIAISLLSQLNSKNDL